jgi:hypothetical protein
MHSFISYSNCSPSHQSFCSAVSACTEPKTFKEASSLECWQKAMMFEIDALQTNRTWSLVKLPPGKRVVGCKWVYRVKLKADGSIERYKARLVAKGFTQTEGVDFFETFSLVAKLTTLRLLLSLATTNNWMLQQLDINNAFLHGDLHEEVYMKPPPGLPLPRPNLVCRLHKSLFGLRQASRQWNQKLTKAIKILGYRQSNADPSLFVRSRPSSFTALLVYVDDIILTGNDSSEIHQVKQSLDTQFHIKDLGALKFFLGLEVSRSKTGLMLNQRKYCLELLDEYGLLGCKPAPTPLILQINSLSLMVICWMIPHLFEDLLEGLSTSQTRIMI